MLKLVDWSPELDLNKFYKKASEKGYENNASQQMLVDCFSKEETSSVWILYNDSDPIGSVAAHSLDFIDNSYRICARTCILTENSGIKHLRTIKKTIQQHQNITAQIFIPVCISWAGNNKALYITSNQSKVGSQRLVHNIYCPSLEKTGVLSRAFEKEYRGLKQTFWKLDVEEFTRQLNQYGKWDLSSSDQHIAII